MKYKDYAPSGDKEMNVTPTNDAVAKLMASSPVVGFLFGFGLSFGLALANYLMSLMK